MKVDKYTQLYILPVYTISGGLIMKKLTKVFKSGHSQAVRLPKDFQLKSKVVQIYKRDNEIVIRELPTDLSEAFDLFTQLPDDFFAEGRDDKPPQEREDL